jgi:hypothetical protein
MADIIQTPIVDLSEISPHPLKAALRKRNIPLWKLRKALGGSPSETVLSRILSGIDPMKPELRERIKQVLKISREKGA